MPTASATATSSPVSGSWTGAAKTGIGYFSKTDGTWHLRNDATTSGASDYAFGFGNGNDIPVTGDWNGDGKTGIGVYDPSDGTLHLRNDATTSGASDYVYSFGVSNMALVSGNFDGIGGAGIGYYNKSDGTLHLRNDASSAGGSDYAYGFGATNTVPVSGNWNGNVPATTAAGLASQLLAKWGGNLTGNPGVHSDLVAASQGQTITNSDTCGNTISLDKDLLQVILQITTRYQLFLDNIVTGHGCDQYYHPMGLATDMGGLTDPVSGATTNFTSGSGSDNLSLDRSFVGYLANILTGYGYNTGLGQSGCSGRTGIAMPAPGVLLLRHLHPPTPADAVLTLGFPNSWSAAWCHRPRHPQDSAVAACPRRLSSSRHMSWETGIRTQTARLQRPAGCRLPHLPLRGRRPASCGAPGVDTLPAGTSGRQT